MVHATSFYYSGKVDILRFWLTSVSVFFFGALALFIPMGFALGPVILLLASISLAAHWPKPVLNNADYQLIASLFLYTAIVVISFLWHGENLRTLYKPLVFWMALPVLFWIISYPPRFNFIWSGLAVGAISACFIAIWQQSQGLSRATGYLHPIQFGNISMLLGVMCLAGMGWAWQQHRRNLWLMFLFLGAISGIMASFLSGSRGGWVGLPLILWVLYRAYGKDLPLKTKILASGLIVIMVLGVYQSPETGVKQRVALALDDISLYYQDKSVTTSIGLRFEMWKGATHLAMERPLLGWGENNYKAAMTDLSRRGIIHPEAAQFEHAHNQFLDVLAKYGIPGLAALLMLLFLPLWLFSRDLRDKNLSIRSLATSGALLCMANIDFNLTQASFMHKSGVIIYAFWLVIWWGTLHAHRSQKHTTPTHEAACSSGTI